MEIIFDTFFRAKSYLIFFAFRADIDIFITFLLWIINNFRASSAKEFNATGRIGHVNCE